MRRYVFPAMLFSALIFGILLGWVDSRPGWDDTGITAALVLVVSACYGAANPRLAWLWAIALGAWIPIFNIVISNNTGSILALAFAFAGAYAGVAARRLLFRATPDTRA